MNVSLRGLWGRKKTQNPEMISEMISAAHSVLKQAGSSLFLGWEEANRLQKGEPGKRREVHQASYCLTVPQPQVSLEASEQGTQHKSKGAGEFGWRACWTPGTTVCLAQFCLRHSFWRWEGSNWGVMAGKKASFYGVCDPHNAFINVMYIGKELKRYCDGQNSNIKGPPGSTPESENLFMWWDFIPRIEFCGWYSWDHHRCTLSFKLVLFLQC